VAVASATSLPAAGHLECASINVDEAIDSVPDPIVIDVDADELPTQAMSHCVSILSRRKPCHGTHLNLPPGSSPYKVYPFLLHKTLSLPWGISIIHNKMRVISMTCKGQVNHESADSCIECEKALTHNIMDGIMNRMVNGVHENTPLAYQPPAGLVQVIRRKVHAIDTKRFLALEVARKLGTQAQALEDYKKFVLALSEGKAKWVDAVIRAGLKRGAGIQGLMNLVYRASIGAYKPKGFSQEERLKSILFLRLGGRQVLSVANKTLGLPLVSTTRQNTVFTSLIVPASFPSLDIICTNIRSVFESGNVFECCGYVLMINEIKVEERTHWDAITNLILGLCCEHTKHLSVNFCSIEDARAALQAVLDGAAHHAKEVCVSLRYSISWALKHIGNCVLDWASHI